MILARGGGIIDGQGPEGEQTVFPLTISPNQSLLVEELKSKFENIDRRFDSLFERMNNDGNLNQQPKTVAPDSDSQVICKQISDVLDQWTGRRTQNYFELKHIFQLLNAFSAERYHGNGLKLVLQRAREVLAASKTSWNFVRKATVSGDLRDFGFCVDPPKVSFRSSRPFRRGCRLGMRGPVIRKKANQPSSNQ